MAGIFQGLADYIFGIDPINDQQRQQQEEYLAQQARDYAAREQADYLHQSNYGRMLLDQISGRTPSPADLELSQGLDTITRQRMSQVAGASGNNAALTGYGALLGSGDAAMKFLQAKAIQRAQETNAAQTQYGNLLAGMGARSAGLLGSAQQTGLGYGQLGTEVAMANQKAKAASQGTFLSSLGAGIGSLIGGGAGARAGATAGGGASSYANSPNDYSAAMPGYEASNINYGSPGGDTTYGSALTVADQPQDPYQSSYANGIYRYPSTSGEVR